MRKSESPGGSVKLLLGWQATKEDVEKVQARLPGCDLLITDRRADLQYFECDTSSLRQRILEAEILMGWIAPRDVIESAPNLKMISWLHAGCDQLDFDLLQRKKIVLTKVAGSNAVAVAEQAMALLLALARRIIQNHALVTNGGWRPLLEPGSTSMELESRTLGIIGLGRIGEEVAHRGRAFSMKVIATKDDPSKHQCNADHVYRADDLLAVLAQADFVVLAVPLTPKTLGMIGEQALRAMKSTAYLINICRGAVVQEAALYAALTNGWIQGYASDVWWDYPDSMPPAYHYNVPSRTGVHRLPNVICSGDRSCNIPSIKERMIETGIQNIACYLRGEQPPLLVNPSRRY